MIISQKWLPLALVIGIGFTAALTSMNTQSEEREHRNDRHKVSDNRHDSRRDSDHRRDTRYGKHAKKNRRNEGRSHSSRHRHESRRPSVIYRGPILSIPPQRIRKYRNTVVIRPYGHWYPGYAHLRLDHDAFKWLAFTAITLKILDNLNEEQQRAHESAQVRATTAPIGEKIMWNEGNAFGFVTTTREGTSTSGRYCREFLQEANIGGRNEKVYGTACRNSDDSWEVVSTETP